MLLVGAVPDLFVSVKRGVHAWTSLCAYEVVLEDIHFLLRMGHRYFGPCVGHVLDEP